MIGGLILDDVPDTRDSLLIRVADQRDQGAWERFARIYRPVVYKVARMRGLQDADAQDVAQQVLVAVARAQPTWERRDEPKRHDLHQPESVACSPLLRLVSEQLQGKSSSS